MDRLTEIRTQIECYQNFLEDLEEITSALETNTGLGLVLQNDSMDIINFTNTEELIDTHKAIKVAKRLCYRHLDPIVRDYVNVLLVLWARANAKMGEIAFLLEESIGQLQNEEDEILADMEQSANRQKDVQ